MRSLATRDHLTLPKIGKDRTISSCILVHIDADSIKENDAPMARAKRKREYTDKQLTLLFLYLLFCTPFCAPVAPAVVVARFVLIISMSCSAVV